MARYILTCDEWDGPVTLDTPEELKAFMQCADCNDVIDLETNTVCVSWPYQIWAPLEKMPADWIVPSEDAG